MRDQGDVFREVAALLHNAQRILIITGAGLSADSGLPTYRGIGGLYHERLTEEGLSIEEALSGEMFHQQPEIVWKYIAEIEANCRDAQPNAAHRLIAALEQEKQDLWLLTQNIDGLHRMAGSSKVIEIHGRVHHLCCTACSYHEEVASFSGLRLPPLCPDCGQNLRPDVVLFGEMLPEPALAMLETVLSAGLDLVISIGTSSVFPYIAGPVWWAEQAGVPTVEINPGQTEVSRLVSYRIQTGAADAMMALWQHLYPDAEGQTAGVH